MEYAVSPSDIAELAAQVEKRGAAFYSQAALLTKNPQARKLFQKLASDELEHQLSFEHIAANTQEATISAMYDIDILDHIKKGFMELLESSAFDPAHLKDDFSEIHAIEVGIHTEQESIQTYAKMKKAFIERFSAVIERLLEQEELHLQLLQNLRERI